MAERARGYRWRNFDEPAPDGSGRSWGSVVATKHGAFASDVDAEAATFAEHAIEKATYLNTPAFVASVHAWARSEVRVRRLSDWLDKHGLLDADGAPRPALNALQREETRAESLRAKLGLDPTSRARLMASLAVSRPDDALEALRAEGREIRQRRAAELEESTDE